MNSTQCWTATVVGLFALSLAGPSAMAQRATPPAQRGGPANTDTPNIVVTAFHAPNRLLAVQAADALRERLQSEHSAKDLFVITKAQVEATLRASGFPVDSALTEADLIELARSVRGDYVIDGTVKKPATAGAVRFETRLLLRQGQQLIAQSLPAADGKDVGDAANKIERSISEALKQMPMYRECVAALRAVKYDDAAVKARAGIAAYPNATYSRVCLLNAYVSAKTAPPDSIINVANQILALDSTSVLALANLADALKAKGDKDKAIDVYLRIYALDPTNQVVVRALIQELGQSAPEKALPILDGLLRDNPGDPELLRNKWLVQLRVGQFKNAIATGDELIKVDTSAATLDFYQRQLGAAQSDSNNAKVQEIASKAAQRFPKEVSFPLLLAQTYRKTGQLQQAMQAALRATEVDPKDTRGWLLAVVGANDLNQPDTALALAQKGIAAGADKTQIGQLLLTPLGAMAKKAGETKARSDWESTLKFAQTVDGFAPSQGTKFYVGLASFQIGLDAINNAQTLSKSKDKADKTKACEETKVAEDMMATTAMTMTAGGGFNKEAAGQIMTALGQVQEAIPQFKKNLCGGK